MLVGRQVELAALSSLVSGDRPVVVLGEPGIGKTALLRAAVAESERRALFGGALASLRWIDYLPLARALGLRQLGGDVASVARRVRAAVGDDGVLVLDDLQWADGATLQALELMTRTVSIAAAARVGDGATDELLTRLEGLGFATIRLGPLADDDAGRLVRSVRSDMADVSVARLVRRCGGVPLLLTQLAGPEGAASESLRLALSTRLRPLSEGATDLFHQLALIGRPIALESLDGALVAELARTALANVRDDQIELAHAVLGDLAIERLDPDERGAIHRTLVALADSPGEAARHLEAAGDLAEARAAALAAAADAAGQPGEVASHLAVAARCSSGAEADELRLSAAASLTVALQHADAVRVLDGIAGSDDATLAKAATLRSRALWYLGDDDGFRAAIDAALLHGEAAGAKARAGALVEQTRRAIFLDSDPEPDAVTLAREALDAATAAKIPTARAEMLMGLAQYMADEPAWRESLEGALGRARSEGDLDTELVTANNLITAHESSGDPKVGRRLAVEMVARAGEVGMIGWQLQYCAMLLNLDMHAADYTGALAQAVELLDEPLDGRARAQVLTSLVFCLIELGRADVGIERLDKIGGDESTELISIGSLRWLQAEAQLHAGRPAEARRLAREAIELGMTDPFAALVELWASVDLGEVPEPLESHPAPMFHGVRSESLGVVAMAEGDHLAAVRHFDEAAGMWCAYHRRGELRCRWAAAEASRRAGDTADATRRLTELEPELARREMRPLLARVRRSLRELGIRRSARRSRPSDRGLTARELEVMRLVAGGLTNVEIGRQLRLSRSTVTEVVARARDRLGAESRGQAAAMLPR